MCVVGRELVAVLTWTMCVSGVGKRVGMPGMGWDGDWVYERGEVAWGVHTCVHV